MAENEVPGVNIVDWTEEIIPGRFAGQTVIVTGAASGIGRATATRVAREGGRVIAADIVEEKLQEFANELNPTLDGGEIIPVAGNIAKEEDVEKIIAAAGDKIDALANIAGIMDDFSGIGEVSDAVWQRVFMVNVEGLMRLTRATVNVMLPKGEGRIVNISSEAGLRGSAAGVAYTASKHAVIGITKSNAVMYREQGIRTNAVAPGGVATGMNIPGAAEHGAAVTGSYGGNIRIMANAEQLAASVTFLLSKDSVNINGVVLPSDAGWAAV